MSIDFLSILAILCERFWLRASASETSIAENFCAIVTAVIFLSTSPILYGSLQNCRSSYRYNLDRISDRLFTDRADYRLSR